MSVSQILESCSGRQRNELKKHDARAELLFWSLNLLFLEVVVGVVVVVVVVA